MNTVNGNVRNCDITIGTPRPDFHACLKEDKLEWASSQNNRANATEKLQNNTGSITGK